MTEFHMLGFRMCLRIGISPMLKTQKNETEEPNNMVQAMEEVAVTTMVEDVEETEVEELEEKREPEIVKTEEEHEVTQEEPEEEVTYTAEQRVDMLLANETDEKRIQMIKSTVWYIKDKYKGNSFDLMNDKLNQELDDLINNPEFITGSMYDGTSKEDMKRISAYFDTVPESIFPYELLKVIPEVQLSYLQTIEEYSDKLNCDLKMKLYDIWLNRFNEVDFIFKSTVYGSYTDKLIISRIEGMVDIEAYEPE